MAMATDGIHSVLNAETTDNICVKTLIPPNLPLKVIAFNMHGFFQGLPVVEELIDDEIPDIFMLQELTPSKLSNFDQI